LRPHGRSTVAPSVITAGTHAERATQPADRIDGLLRVDERERHSLCLAKKAVACFRMSRSWRNCRTSRRSVSNSVRSSALSRSLGVGPAYREPSMQCRRDNAELFRNVAIRLIGMLDTRQGFGLKFRRVTNPMRPSHGDSFERIVHSLRCHQNGSMPHQKKDSYVFSLCLTIRNIRRVFAVSMTPVLGSCSALSPLRQRRQTGSHLAQSLR
jgi:hypothetical protein